MEAKIYRDFEAYAAIHNASRNFGDAGLHRGSQNQSKIARKRNIKNQARKDLELEQLRDTLRIEYARKIATGEIKEMGRWEKLKQTANGHPDNESVQAARRILTKNGQTWS